MRRIALLLAAACSFVHCQAPYYRPLESFQKWLTDHGGRIASTAAFSTKPNQCTSSRPALSVVTTGRLQKETVVVGVPHDLLLWPAEPAKCSGCDLYELLALRLLDERAAGSSSKWGPYIDLLPQTLDNAVSFGRNELQDLRGTYAGTVVAVAKARVARFVAKVKREQPGLYTDEALRWALGIVLSRSLTVGAPGGSASYNSSSGASSVRYDTPFLAPGADALNHGSHSKVGWTFRAKASGLSRARAANTIDTGKGGNGNGRHAQEPSLFGIVALTALPHAGLEVYNSYEDHATNGHTLAYYGFAEESNPADALVLSIPLLPPALASRAGSVDLLSTALGDARRDLGQHLRRLVEGGKTDAAHADLALALLPSPQYFDSEPEGPVVVPNVTVVLHAPGTPGSSPAIMLNAARIAALGLPATQQWLDTYARARGPRTLAVRAAAPATAAPVVNKTAPATATPAPTSGRHGARASAAAARQAQASASPSAAPSSEGPVRYEVLIPASGEDEVYSVTGSIRDAALSRVAHALEQMLGSAPSIPPVTGMMAMAGMGGSVDSQPVHASVRSLLTAGSGHGAVDQAAHTAAYAVDPATGRVLDLRAIGQQLQASSGTPAAHALPAAFNAPVLLSNPVNSSLLLDLLAHRVLLSSLRRLQAGYPASLREDEHARAALQARLHDIEVVCGLTARVAAGSGRGVPKLSAAEAAAQAFAASEDGGARRLSQPELEEYDSELRVLRTRVAILTARIGELRILQATIERLAGSAGALADRLKTYGIRPIIEAPALTLAGEGSDASPSSASSWEDEWALDLPDIDGYFSVPRQAQQRRAAEVEGEEGTVQPPQPSSLWYHGAHVHEEGDDEDTDHGQEEAAPSRSHASLRSGRVHDNGVAKDADNGHVARHTEHVHEDGTEDVLPPPEATAVPSALDGDAAPATAAAPTNASPAEDGAWQPQLRAGQPIAQTE